MTKGKSTREFSKKNAEISKGNPQEIHQNNAEGPEGNPQENL